MREALQPPQRIRPRRMPSARLFGPPKLRLPGPKRDMAIPCIEAGPRPSKRRFKSR